MDAAFGALIQLLMIPFLILAVACEIKFLVKDKKNE